MIGFKLNFKSNVSLNITFYFHSGSPRCSRRNVVMTDDGRDTDNNVSSAFSQTTSSSRRHHHTHGDVPTSTPPIKDEPGTVPSGCARGAGGSGGGHQGSSRNDGGQHEGSTSTRGGGQHQGSRGGGAGSSPAMLSFPMMSPPDLISDALNT